MANTSTNTLLRSISVCQNFLKNAPLTGFRVYVITNTINGKRYVGKTSRTIQERWKEHKWGQSRTPIHLAIKMHGSSNFKIEELSVANNKEEMDASERRWILEYKTHDKTFGYNLTFGGDGGGHPTDEVIEKHRQNSAKRGPARKDINTSDIITLYTSGLSLVDVAFKLGCSKFMVRQRLLKAGTPRRPSSIRLHTKNRKGGLGARYNHNVSTSDIISLYAEGLSLSKVSERVGLNRFSVTERLKSKGVPIRKSGGTYVIEQHVAA